MLKTDTVIDLFVKQVKKNPNHTALLFENRRLSYIELDQLSNRLANYLRTKGVKEGTLVPICLNRPIDMVIGILGILKADAAYVPIDAEFPVDRIKYMIEDTAAQVLISDHSCSSFLAASGDKTIIYADNNWIETKHLTTAPVQSSLTLSHLAYVIYTSGSTGMPKGVLITHLSLTDYLVGLFKRLPYHTFRSFALGVSFAADSVITNLFGSLVLGAELHLFSKENFNDTEFIHGYFNSHAIDCLKIVPSHWKSLSLNGVDLLPKKLLMFGGEALHTTIINNVIPSSSRTCIIVNHYGPTETTVGQLLHEVQEHQNYGHTIPIGKPFTDASIYLLNEDLTETIESLTGELYIGGACLANGYLNRPELTRERFVNDPFSTDPNARLYRTGDLVRKLENGDIEFLGRIDDQVKIRGYRIELGEIESVLQKAPNVKQAIVLAKPDANGDLRLIGYLVCDGSYHKKEIVSYLESKLPAHMVPQLLMPLDELPFMPNGKVAKKLLPNPDASKLLQNQYVAAKYKTEQNLSELWKEILGVERVGIDDNFFELGGNSLLAQKTVALLKSTYQLNLPVAKLYQFPKIKALAAFLDDRNPKKETSRKYVKKATDSDIAIIGMSGRFPGANSIDDLWTVLKEGKETTRFFNDDELDNSVTEELRKNPDYVKARGIVDGVAGFDAAFFGISPKFAELMDPQQRIFLEIAWEALEKAGYVKENYQEKIGVFAGVRHNSYYDHNVIPNTELVENTGKFQVITLNDKDYVASRTAYALDLKGPAVNIQSACSTSLVAVAQAVQSIRNGFCDMALAGGATINSPVNIGHLYEEGAMLSDDGHCRPFDANAKGTVFSDGAGVVLLKRKEDAIKDGDFIYAIIKGIGLSNDGSDKASFTAPSAVGQAEAIEMAIEDAGINAAEITYIETHGTATPLGDPIEIEGLNMAFGVQNKTQYCSIGSLKSNFGHLTTAAGVAGLIKTTLALHHKQIPPSINYKSPNPNIDFSNSPFVVNTSLKEWDGTSKRIAGVSSFGVGGTNAHIIIEEYENKNITSSVSRPVQLFTWSAKNEQSLNDFKDGLLITISKKTSAQELPDLSFSLNVHKEHFNFRGFVVAGSKEELLSQLEQFAFTPSAHKNIRDVVFMFPGQGAQYLDMGKVLYEQEQTFKAAMDTCNTLFKTYLNEDILAVIYPEMADSVAEEKLRNTRYSQPAIFMVSYAMAKLWMSWGVYPSSFIGHSIGEFVAAHFAGILSLADAINIISVRSQLMSSLPGGSMLTVRGDIEEIAPYLPDNISIAAINAPKLNVLAGTNEAIASFITLLKTKELPYKSLSTSHAFHSYMMDAVLPSFKAAIKGIQFNPPLIDIYSTVTGKKLTAQEAVNPEYWVNHLRATVLFSNAAKLLVDENPEKAFLEMGPGNAAATFIRQQESAKNKVILSAFVQPKSNENAYHPVLRSIGQLWSNGFDFDWTTFYKDEVRNKIAYLPTYAFQRSNYWINPPTTLPITNHQYFSQHIANPIPSQPNSLMRTESLIDQVKKILENSTGIEMQGVSSTMSFIEIGLDSLLLTQIALILKKNFGLPITFRQLNEEYNSLDKLGAYLAANIPQEAEQTTNVQIPNTVQPSNYPQRILPDTSGTNYVALDLISQQLQLLASQVASLQTGAPVSAPIAISKEKKQEVRIEQAQNNTPKTEEVIETSKPFGASPKIEKQSTALTQSQQYYLDQLIKKYNDKTKGSKEYTQKNRSHMADPRVVSGFKPATKELVYAIVINKSKGSRLWDIDGNEYIDALNGFGSNLLGYQPDLIKTALIDQIEKGYEIGPQHELAGEVSKLICDFTNFDRSALCNTGSEAVLGAMRIARTVTNRALIVAFSGSYHGILDEVIVRGNKLRSFPAAPGIMPEAVQNMLILDYGTDESLKIIEERASELAAVLVEPIQSRRPEFQPIEFLKQLRKITAASGTALIFDEVISGFRFHPAGIRGMYGIDSDIGTYGKVAGGGISIGIIAGKRKFMDALDGGHWNYGDDSVPEIGVTYFAGTFVRHPLALATAKASLTYMKSRGPELQSELNEKTKYIADTINALCKKFKSPMFVAQFGSLWRIKYKQEYAYSELFFTLMRYKGIHILEGFPCFLTTAHTQTDIDKIITAFEECLLELKTVGFIPEYEEKIDFNNPPLPNARIGKDRDGNPAWFVKDDKNPGNYFQVN